MQVKPLNQASVSPAMVLQEIQSQNPKHILAIFVQDDGAARTLWSSLPLEALCYFHRIIGMSIDAAMQAQHVSVQQKT